MSIAIYKGRKYKLLWQGQGKYGPCAKLGFFDGTKQFFVKEGSYEISESDGDSPQAAARRAGVRRGMARCPECGGWRHHSDIMCGEPCD